MLVVETCPTCGGPWEWRCRKCGSTDRRPNGKGCAECNRRASREWRAAARDEFDDIVITPAARAYLAAFDAYLMAGKTGDSRERRRAAGEKARALERLEGPLT